MAEKTKPFTGNTFNKVETMRGAFESQYGAPANDNKKVLIGMRGGKAVYGDELDAVDTTGAQYVGTYSKNQAIMNDMSKEMARSGGMYNPSSNNIRLEGTPAPTENDYKTTIRASDGRVMVGALSPDAAAMREKPDQTADQRFAATMARLTGKPAPTAPASPAAPKAPTAPANPAATVGPATTTRPTILPFPEYGTEDAINKTARPTVLPFPEYGTEDAITKTTNENANYLTGLINKRKKNSSLDNLTMV